MGLLPEINNLAGGGAILRPAVFDVDHLYGESGPTCIWIIK